MTMLVGVDLVAIETIRSAIARFGDRYRTRVFTTQELAYCESRGDGEISSLAARFAAKEATVKLLAESSGWPMTDIEVTSSPTCQPGIRLHGPAALVARNRRITCMAVSLSHEGDYAVAVVTAKIPPLLTRRLPRHKFRSPVVVTIPRRHREP